MKLPTLENLRELITSTDHKTLEDSVVFELKLDNNSINKILRFVENKCIEDLFYLKDIDLTVDLEDLKNYIDDSPSFTFEIIYPNLREIGVNIYKDLCELISYRSNKISVPNEFYLIKENIIYPYVNGLSGKTRHYIDAVAFIKHLTNCADYFERDILKIVLLNNTRLDIDINYTSETLPDGFDGLSIIDAFFKDPLHADHKKTMFKQVLSRFLKNIKTEDRLNFLFANFGEFSKRLNENYQLFVSEFSFDKVRREFEEKKRDYILKLNNLFSDLSAKLLSIPVAFILTFTNIKPIKSELQTEILIQNSAILASIFFFTIYMLFLIKNQLFSLDAIETEYTGVMQRLKYSQANQIEQIESDEEELNKRYRFLKRLFRFSFAAVIIALLFTLLLFSLRFQEIRNYLIQYFQEFKSFPEGIISFMKQL